MRVDIDTGRRERRKEGNRDAGRRRFEGQALCRGVSCLETIQGGKVLPSGRGNLFSVRLLMLTGDRAVVNGVRTERLCVVEINHWSEHEHEYPLLGASLVHVTLGDRTPAAQTSRLYNRFREQ